MLANSALETIFPVNALEAAEPQHTNTIPGLGNGVAAELNIVLISAEESLELSNSLLPHVLPNIGDAVLWEAVDIDNPFISSMAQPAQQSHFPSLIMHLAPLIINHNILKFEMGVPLTVQVVTNLVIGQKMYGVFLRNLGASIIAHFANMQKQQPNMLTKWELLCCANIFAMHMEMSGITQSTIHEFKWKQGQYYNEANREDIALLCHHDGSTISWAFLHILDHVGIRLKLRWVTLDNALNKP
ncbi:hypothetical protein BDQ17DRAFT_1333185 [Cyathus striatus]|nr:hypothetical protein BDQ17DRAFT_1333185 [Cyathus striatus]